MRRVVVIISIVLVFAFAFIVTAQETDGAEDKIANLKQQLMEIEGLETDSRIRLEELDEQLKPENIERALAGIGSTHPEQLREYQRKLLTIERDGVQTQLNLLEENRARIKAAIAAAESAAYLKSALPSPTPSSETSPSGTVRGAIITKGTDAQSYNIAGAKLQLKGMDQLTEASSNDQGEYEFTDLSVGEYTLQVSAQGFKTVNKVVAVRAGKTLLENITLEMAEIQESIKVKSASEGVQTTEAAPAIKRPD